MSPGWIRSAAFGDLVDQLRTTPLVPRPGVAVPLEPSLLATLAGLIACDVVVYNDKSAQRRTQWAGSNSLGDYATQDDCVDGDDDAFFDLYWGSYCSHPERTGDFESVTLGSDFESLHELRASPMYRLLKENDAAFDRMMLVPLPAPPGHSRRVRFVRAYGHDFCEDDRALATILQPHLLARIRALDLAGREVAPLTTRQRQLLALVADGYSNQQAARALGISALTVRTHLEQTYARLGVHSRTEAIAALRQPLG